MQSLVLRELELLLNLLLPLLLTLHDVFQSVQC
jgi:hypothetical protein